MVLIYILKLCMDKWYIGKANDNHPEHRLEDHFKNNGSGFTKQYPPIQVFKVIPHSDHFDEDKITLQYMAIYGIDNVRGGSFCEIILDQKTKDIITKMLQTSCDLCFGCGKRGHFLNKCPIKKQHNSICSEDKSQICGICGSKDHNIIDCLTNLAMQPIEVPIKKLCMLCGSKDHNMTDCTSMKEHSPVIKKTLCYTCGSMHTPDDCIFTISNTKPQLVEETLSNILCEYCDMGFSTNIKLIAHKLECDKIKEEKQDNKSESCCMQ